MRRVQHQPNVTVIPMVEDAGAGAGSGIRIGRPTDHMPPLSPDDIVYACGAPKMVDAVEAAASEAGATFYADPFLPQTEEEDDTIFSKAVDMLRTLVPQGNVSVPALPRPDGHQQKAADRFGLSRLAGGRSRSDPPAIRRGDAVRTPPAQRQRQAG